MQIALRGGFHIDQLERLIEALQPLTQATEPTRVALDLSDLAFLGPTALATLVTWLADSMKRGVVAAGSVYVPPANRLMATYLERAGLHALITDGQLEQISTVDTRKGFPPFQIFTCDADVDELSQSLTKVATNALAMSSKERLAVLLAITELAQNVLDHADSPIGGVAMAHPGRRRQEFEIAIADAGIGIAASLRRNRSYRTIATDAAAITKALSPGVSSDPGRKHAGDGLAAIRGFLQENGGVLLVRSGSGAVEDGSRQAAHDDRPRLRGTLVALRMRIDRPFDLTLFRQRGGDGSEA